MKERTKAYAAGLLDAEGSIGIGKNNNSRGVNYSAKVTISNKSRPLMNWLVQHFGGYLSKTNPKKSTHAVCYSWHLSSAKHTRRFLETVLPYLQIKKPQAIVLFEYLDMDGETNPTKRESLYRTLRELKKHVRVTTETPTSSKETYAYLAGFFDGEGSSSIIRFTGHGYVQHAPRVFVTNTDKPILDAYRDLFGGVVVEHRNGGMQCYRWELRKNAEREKFLLYVLPYLIVKHEEANIVLQFLRLGKAELPCVRGEFYDKLVKLKRERMIQSQLHGDMQSGDNESCQPTRQCSEHDQTKTIAAAQW